MKQLIIYLSRLIVVFVFTGDAISKDQLIRLTLEEGVAVPIIYLRSGTDIEVLEGS